MFSGLIGESDKIQRGADYTFTFEHGRLFEYRSDSWVFAALREQMAPYAEILSVDRPLFSSRYIVLLRPKSTFLYTEFIALMMSAWDGMGYGSAKFLAAETEFGSSYPGGITEVASDIAKSVQQSIMAGVKPFFPFVVIGLGAYFYLTKKGR
jgi:hypothetical protein